MEPERSSLHSQEPATCPYPEPDQSPPHPSSLFFNHERKFVSRKAAEMNFFFFDQVDCKNVYLLTF